MKNKPEAPVRPLRADAARNRERVLAAARAAFGSDGVQVPLDEVARRAGVGPGTVHRHFPTKESLLEAIVAGTIERLTSEARRQLRAPEPGEAFYGFFGRMVHLGSKNRAFTAALDEHAGISGELFAVTAELLQRAQMAGAVRPDVDVRHVKATLIGVLAGWESMGGKARSSSDDRRHLVALACDAFRPRLNG
jgi:AcrR family transcriptional regulator